MHYIFSRDCEGLSDVAFDVDLLEHKATHTKFVDTMKKLTYKWDLGHNYNTFF